MRSYADTNVIIRFLTDEPKAQAQTVSAFLRNLPDSDDELFVCELVLAEAVYVLESYYERPRAETARVLRSFCSLPGVVLENETVCAEALATYARENVDYTDAYLAARARAKAAAVFTFDRDFERLGVSII